MDPVDPLLAELRPILAEPTGTSSAGWPYLSRAAWVRLRDWVPHHLSDGLRVWEALGRAADDPALEPAITVVRQIVRTAAITAPTDLWLVRQVVGGLVATGWRDRLAHGLVDPPAALVPDLTLLLARGYLVRGGGGSWRLAEEPTARRVMTEVEPVPSGRPADLAHRFAGAFAGDRASHPVVLEVLGGPIPDPPHRPPAWVATPEDLELGYRLVPIVLGLRSKAEAFASADRVLVGSGSVQVDDRVLQTLLRAGWVGEHGELTAIGRRGLVRGPGPFGIIEAYHPYLARLPEVWEARGGQIHVARAANVAASQDANRATFERANDALDRFCADTGFRWQVFVEHAVGRGEAIRQRYARSGDSVAYVGADLEEAAIDAARAEVAGGRLPSSLRFVRADIGRPDQLVAALERVGLPTEGAVMVVGNGFHEVRGAGDDSMIEVFRGYERAGIVLSFTEESALSVDDLLETAWNTYHAGFRYVHERSGQRLRPAGASPVPGLGPPLGLSWAECATRAGYVRVDRYCSRSRTIYPYPPANGHNPSVSSNQMFVPARIAARLGSKLTDPTG